jgi:accessory Sec system S-layer assembly protein
MFKLLDRLKKGTKKRQGEESSVLSQELFGDDTQENNTDNEKPTKTGLSLHPEARLSQEDHYYFQFLQNDLPDLKANQVSIAGIDLKKNEDSLLVTAFVRNSLSKGIKLAHTHLLLVGPAGERIAREEFDLSLLGEIPAASSRPWQFTFPLASVENREEIPVSGWKLAFELISPHKLDLEESWKKSMANEDVSKLDRYVRSIKAPKPGEVNFMGLKSKVEEGTLHITLLIRNGSQKDITLQQLPLVVEDASGAVVAKGGFTLDDFKVKANTSKPWTFIFPETLVEGEPDLSKWKAYPLQK